MAPLSSMTGFARRQGVAGAYGWAWEIRSVNAKGLDLRLRLPPGWDAIEPALRARAAEVVARGTLHGTLNVEREGVAPVVKVNDEVLKAVIATLNSLAGRIEAEPARLDGILAIKGVIEVADADEREEDRAAAQAAVRRPRRKDEGSGDHAHDVGFLHDQEVVAVDLDLRPGPLAEQDPVADLDVDRGKFA